MKGSLILPTIFILLICTPALADFDKGWEAYYNGDYATALKEFKPLAEQGDAKAQFNLGVRVLSTFYGHI